MELVGWLVGCLVGYLINPLNAKLNPICHLLALLEAHHILHFSRIRVKDSCCHGTMNIVYWADGHFHADLHYTVALLACISTLAQTV